MSFVWPGWNKEHEPPHDKTNKMACAPSETQISLGVRTFWSESSLLAQWVTKDPRCLHADGEDSVQTGWMPRLVWVFVIRACHFVGFVMRRLNIFCSVTCMSSCYFLVPVDTIHQARHDKTNKVTVHPAKTHISLGIRPVWSESSLSAWRTLGPLAIHWAHSKDSDQTGQMPRLIWVFAGRTVTLLVLSCRG